MTKPTLILMCGVPGAGKSYFARKIEETHEDCIIVSRDAIRFALLQPEDDYFAYESQVIEMFHRNISLALERHRYVIADATHLSRKARKQMVQRYRSKARLVAVFIDVSVQTALKNNENRSGRAYVPPAQIQKMFKHKVPIDSSEHFDEVIFISADADLAISKTSAAIENINAKLEGIR